MFQKTYIRSDLLDNVIVIQLVTIISQMVIKQFVWQILNTFSTNEIYKYQTSICWIGERNLKFRKIYYSNIGAPSKILTAL